MTRATPLAILSISNRLRICSIADVHIQHVQFPSFGGSPPVENIWCNILSFRSHQDRRLTPLAVQRRCGQSLTNSTPGDHYHHAQSFAANFLVSHDPFLTFILITPFYLIGILLDV